MSAREERQLTADNLPAVDAWLDQFDVFAKQHTRYVDGELTTVGLRVGEKPDHFVAFFGDTIVRHADGRYTVRRAQVEDPHDGPLASRYMTPHDLPPTTIEISGSAL